MRHTLHMRALLRYDVTDDVILHTSVRLVWPVNPVWLGRPRNLTRSEPPKIILKKQKQTNKKKWEKNALTKWTFNFDQKVKIYKRGLCHSVFRVHSNFGIRFFVQDLEIVQTI